MAERKKKKSLTFIFSDFLFLFARVFLLHYSCPCYYRSDVEMLSCAEEAKDGRINYVAHAKQWRYRSRSASLLLFYFSIWRQVENCTRQAKWEASGGGKESGKTKNSGKKEGAV